MPNSDQNKESEIILVLTWHVRTIYEIYKYSIFLCIFFSNLNLKFLQRLLVSYNRPVSTTNK